MKVETIQEINDIMHSLTTCINNQLLRDHTISKVKSIIEWNNDVCEKVICDKSKNSDKDIDKGIIFLEVFENSTSKYIFSNSLEIPRLVYIDQEGEIE